MKMKKVESSLVEKIGYNKNKNILRVKLKNFYDFFHVPEDIHKDFLSADSKGKYFNKHIKSTKYDKKYEYKPVKEEDFLRKN